MVWDPCSEARLRAPCSADVLPALSSPPPFCILKSHFPYTSSVPLQRSSPLSSVSTTEWSSVQILLFSWPLHPGRPQCSMWSYLVKPLSDHPSAQYSLLHTHLFLQGECNFRKTHPCLPICFSRVDTTWEIETPLLHCSALKHCVKWSWLKSCLLLD